MTVDHGLQDGSTERAAAVVEQMAALGADETMSVRVRVDAPGVGPEAAAREARYAALGQAAASLDTHVVLLGHTLDDQAETVLMGLTRGSGGRSLSGMRRAYDDYRRPLLDVTRAQTEAACRAEGITWWDDPHNDDPRFLRSRVRRTVMPLLEQELGPGVATTLARTADQLRADMEALDDLAEALLAQTRTGTSLEVVARRTHAVRPAAGAGLPGAAPGRARRRGPGRRAVRRPRRGAVQRPARDGPRRGPAPRPSHGVPLRGLPAIPAYRCGRLSHMDSHHIENDLVDILFTEEEIQAKLVEMAKQIQADYEGKDLLMVGVLRGAVMVMADLARSLDRQLEMDWMAVSSYGSGTKSSGVVRILKDLDTDITGRHVLVVDEIIDTGLTLSWLISNLSSRNAASVEIATLLRKPEALAMPVEPKYVGWDIPNEFVVGYGLDYNEKYRNLRCIGTLAPHVYS